MGKTVDIIVDENGEVTFETSGFTGKACELETAWIKEELGIKEKLKKLKPEYYKKETIKNVVRNQT